MKRKSVFLTIAVVLVLLAVYGIWHYSPLRYLTQSKSDANQTHVAAVENRSRPVIITKKIRPEPQNTQQTGDLPRPLVVLKQITPEETPEPAQPKVEVEVPAAVEKKIPSAAPQVASSPKTDQTQVIQAKEPVKPQPSPKKVAALQPKSSYPYSIMLSSCRLPQSARKIVSDFQKVGLAPYVVKVEFKSGEEWLRVLTGHYQTRGEALKAKQEHRLSDAIIKKTPYTNLIGTYTSTDAMEADLRRVQKLGYSPYYLKTPEGELKLLVGAFVSKQGAEKQQAELQAKGVENSVTIR